MANEKAKLGRLARKYSHQVHNPEDWSTATTLNVRHDDLSTAKYARTEIIELFPNEFQRNIFFCWLETTTEMYNRTVREINRIRSELKEAIKEAKKNPTEENLKKEGKCWHEFNRSRIWKVFRTKTMQKHITELNETSGARLIRGGDMRYFPPEKYRVYAHTLQSAVKQCSTSFDVMLKNKKSGHIKKYTLRELNQDRTNKVMEIDASYLSNPRSEFHKMLGDLIAIRDGKYYDFSSIKSASMIKYNRKNDKFTLLVPIKEVSSNLDKPNKVISVDPGIRCPINYINNNHASKIGKNIVKKIRSELDSVAALNSRLVSGKAKRKRRRRAKYKIRNIVTNFHWDVANFLSMNAETVVFGDIDVCSIVKKRNETIPKISKKILRHLRIRGLIEKLKFKCSTRNTTLILVDEKYTSRTCSFCGFWKENLGGAKRFNCDGCKINIDRDFNACRNMLYKSTLKKYCNS